MEAVYDRYGRMKYNPVFHENNGKPWSMEEIQYLKDWYDIIGAEEMSFALSRTMGTVQNKVLTLRKYNQMKYPDKFVYKAREAHKGHLTEVIG